VLLYSGRYAEAVADLKRVIAADPSNILARFELGAALAGAGKFRESLAAFPDAIDTETGVSTSNHAWAYHRAGMNDSARVILNELLARSRQRYVSPAALAIAAAASGDNTRSISYLDDAVREHSFFLAFLGASPEFDPLHGDPRYERILAQVQKNFH
jgi:tetratricopeptide (TPR) repeat protein